MQEIGSLRPAWERASRPRSGTRVSGTLGALALIVLALGRVFPDSPTLQGWLWPCPLKVMSGLPCPTCGLTRVSVHLAHFEMGAALALAPLPALALLFALGAGLWAATARLLRRPGPDDLLARTLGSRRGGLILGCLAVALYVFALVRSAMTGAP